MFRVFVFENPDGCLQFTPEFIIQLLHEHQAYGFVRGAFDQAVFKGVGKRTVPDVVQQDGYGNGTCLVVSNFVATGPDHFNGLAHQVHGSDGMLKPGVVCARVYISR